MGKVGSPSGVHAGLVLCGARLTPPMSHAGTRRLEGPGWFQVSMGHRGAQSPQEGSSHLVFCRLAFYRTQLKFTRLAGCMLFLCCVVCGYLCPSCMLGLEGLKVSGDSRPPWGTRVPKVLRKGALTWSFAGRCCAEHRWSPLAQQGTCWPCAV